MKKQKIVSMICAGIFSAGLIANANAALLSRLSGNAFYDDQLDITWAANANINGVDTWENQLVWAAGLTISGVSGWRLPNMNIDGGSLFNCASGTQAACKDNEYGHLYYYGASTTLGGGITQASPGPFSNIQSTLYWSGNPRNVVVAQFEIHP